jgi:hypothetical protein
MKLTHHAVSILSVFSAGVGIGGFLEVVLSGGTKRFFAEWETQSK